MAKATNETPPQGDQNGGAGGSGGAGVPPTDEQRIAAQREADLRRQASEAVADAQAARGEAEAAKGDVGRLTVELAGVKAERDRLAAQVEQLAQAQTAREGLPSLPVDLPRGAFQLTESVTFAVLGEDGKPTRPAKSPRRGDVVFVAPKDSELSELRAGVGLVATVHPIDKATADELRKLKYIR